MRRFLSKKFFWTITSVFLYIFLFSLVSRIFGLSFWQPDNTSVFSIYAFQHSAETADIVLLGSSRVMRGLSPLVMGKEIFRRTGRRQCIFNLGQSAGFIRISYVILRDVLKGKRTPKLIVLGVDTRGLNSNNDLGHHYFKYYASQLDILGFLIEADFFGREDPRLQGTLRNASSLLWLVGRNPFQSKYREQLASLTESKGFVPRDGKGLVHMNENERRRRIDHVRERLLADYAIEEENDRAFRLFISLCKKRGIRLIVVNMPVHPDFMRAYDDNQYETFLKYVDGICAQHGIRFVNLQNEPIPLDDGDFGNYDHLSTEGAEKVSTYLAGEALFEEIQNL